MKAPFKIVVSTFDGDSRLIHQDETHLKTQEDLVAAQDALSETAKVLRHSSLKTKTPTPTK